MSDNLPSTVEDEMPSNAKSYSGVGYIIVALFIGIVPEILIRWLDHVEVDQTPTQVALAKLELQVSELKEQVKALNEQPYVRREEFESRLTGFDHRLSEIERTKQSGH